jgi:hypothetical protein
MEKTPDSMVTSTKLLNWALLLVILAGVIFSTVNLLYSRSLWLDEASLSLNLLNRSYAELLKPLDHRQVAPIGFLLLSKAVGSLANYQDLALRVIPFIFYLASVPLCWLFVIRLTGDRTLAYLTTALFTLNVSIIQYASEIKQYSADVAIALAILAVAVDPENRPHRMVLIRSLLFGVCVWFSNVSIIMMALAGGYMLGQYIFVKKRWPGLLDVAPYVIGLVSFGLYYYFFIYDHPTREFMLNYWRRENAFFPSWREPGVWPAYLAEMAEMFFRRLLPYGTAWPIGLLVFLVGIVASLRRPAQLWFVLGALLVHTTLSSLELYPIARRLCLYMAPLFCLQIASGLWGGYLLVRRFIPFIPAWLMLLPVLMHMSAPVNAYPTERYAVKKSIADMSRSIEPEDTIFVHPLAERTFRYYQRFYPEVATHTSILYGSRLGTNVQAIARDLSRVESDRMWALFAVHIKRREPEGDAVLEAAREHGFKLIDLYAHRRSFSALLVRDDEVK